MDDQITEVSRHLIKEFAEVFIFLGNCGDDFEKFMDGHRPRVIRIVRTVGEVLPQRPSYPIFGPCQWDEEEVHQRIQAWGLHEKMKHVEGYTGNGPTKFQVSPGEQGKPDA